MPAALPAFPAPDNLFVLSETNIDNIARLVDEFSVEFLIIDSIQTIYTEDISSAPGSVSQVRSCGNLLMSIGKKKNVPVFIVAHVTKSGELAGPKVVEHLVDCVLHFSGERNKELRILRAYKNRFGTVSEIGAFQMEDEGLREVFNLSGTFLEDSESQKEGSIVGAVYEGTRPLLLEIQALTAYTNMALAASRLDAFSGYPFRTWPTSGAPGGTTGAPEVRPSRSSRTGDGSPRVSCARRG